jgi:hypothetical protein
MSEVPKPIGELRLGTAGSTLGRGIGFHPSLHLSFDEFQPVSLSPLGSRSKQTRPSITQNLFRVSKQHPKISERNRLTLGFLGWGCGETAWAVVIQEMPSHAFQLLPSTRLSFLETCVAVARLVGEGRSRGLPPKLALPAVGNPAIQVDAIAFSIQCLTSVRLPNTGVIPERKPGNNSLQDSCLQGVQIDELGLAIFLIIKQINRLKKAPPPAEPCKKDCPKCCSSIPIKAIRCPHCTSDLWG